MRYKNDRATYCHTSRIPVRRPCCQRVHLCPRRFLCWRYETEVRSSLEHFSRSSFSLRSYRRGALFFLFSPQPVSLSSESFATRVFCWLVFLLVFVVGSGGVAGFEDSGVSPLPEGKSARVLSG